MNATVVHPGGPEAGRTAEGYRNPPATITAGTSGTRGTRTATLPSPSRRPAHAMLHAFAVCAKIIRDVGGHSRVINDPCGRASQPEADGDCAARGAFVAAAAAVL